jgi:bifunctional DNase/RNase
VTVVRVVLADPRSGRVPAGSAVNGQQLIVLADDAGQRAVPLWLGVVDAKLLLALPALLKRPAGDAVTAGVLEELAARLLHAAGVAVTAVDIEPASEDVPELRSDTAWARAGLATEAGTRHVKVSAGYGLKLAVAAGVPVRVADAVMDRRAIPVQGEDLLAPFLLPAAGQLEDRPGQARRFEPRNMAFTDGLDRWELAGSFLAAGRPHWQDYSCTAADQSAVVTSAVPEPSGSAVLFQEIFAEDYRGRTVTFRGQLRAAGAGQAGLHLAAGQAVDPPGVLLRDRGGSSRTGPGSSDWSQREVTVPVPQGAGVIRFGISLTGRGRIELRNPELSAARPETRE